MHDKMPTCIAKTESSLTYYVP